MTFADAPRNKLLAALPREDYARIEPSLTLAPLAQRQILQRAGQPVEAVYFPADGLCSIILTMADGRTAEVATVGNEGMVGVTAALGGESTPGDTIVQVPGT